MFEIDQKRFARQQECYNNWVKANCNAVICAAPGFGKTFIAVMCIRHMNKKHPEFKTIVVVPTTLLKNDWTTPVTGHIAKFNLLNVSVFVVNTFTNYDKWKTDLLVLDEIHHYLSYDSKQFSKVLAITEAQFRLGLTATLGGEVRESFLKEHGLVVADTVSELESEKEGYTASSIVYNLSVPLSEKDRVFNTKINDSFKYFFTKFDHEFNLMKACNLPATTSCYVKLRNGTSLGSKTGAEWRKYWAAKNKWNGDPAHPFSPENISKWAAQGMSTMRKRKEYWHNLESKIDYVEKLVKMFSGKKIAIFSESASFADKIAERLGNSCMSYHTKLSTLAFKEDGKKVVVKDATHRKELKALGYEIKGLKKLKEEAISKFQDKTSNIKQLSTVRAFDEGVDVQSIEVVIMASYNSTVRQDTQRAGRGKRIDYENLAKKALIVNLYVKGTQEEKWLTSKQKGKRLVRFVDNVSEIILHPTLSLSRNKDGESRGSQATDSGAIKQESNESAVTTTA